MKNEGKLYLSFIPRTYMKTSPKERPLSIHFMYCAQEIPGEASYKEIPLKDILRQ
jgi:hypothetical protein